MTRLRAVAYHRVSSSQQVDGFSLDAQERLFYEACRNRGWEPVRVYREEGRSAHSDSLKKRPVLRQLLSDAKKGEFDIVVVHTLDRWARNLEVLIRTVKALKECRVELQSITESLDYSNPQGRLLLQLLGSFAEFSSDMLAEHVKKGLKERATQGLNLGSVPFGFRSCWTKEGGERKRLCDPEHQGGVHVVEEEASAIVECFQRYAAGSVSCGELASWLNDRGFRTRNTKKFLGPDGSLAQGPRLFTSRSVADLLKNRFFIGMVKYKDEFFQGLHKAIVSNELFDIVQAVLKKNNGRSMTLSSKPYRQYLLKGLIRCAYCLMPMWAQTYKHGTRVYREHKASRSHGRCPSMGSSIKCDVADDQVGKLVEAFELGPSWMEEVLALVAEKDQIKDFEDLRTKTKEKLQRLGKAYVDGLYEEADYKGEKNRLELELESLATPQLSAAADAGLLMQDLPTLWRNANLEERRKLLLSMLDGVYVEAKELRQVVAIQPKPAFRPIFQVATTKTGSGIALIKEPPDQSQEALEPNPCFWWRRGRVELPVHEKSRKNMLQA